MNLDDLIRKTEASLTAETSPKRKAEIAADLAMYTRTKAECDDGDDDDEEDDEDEKKSKKSAKKKAEAHAAKPAAAKKKAEAEDDEEDEEEEKKSKKAAAAAPLSDDAAEILSSQASMATEALARVQKLEKAADERDRQARIAALKAERRITPGEATKWAKKDSKFWAQVEEMRPTALVNIDEEALLVPDGTPAADISASVKRIVEQAVNAQGLTGKAADEFRQAAYADQRAASALGNGVH
jgi:hypothetical protein